MTEKITQTEYRSFQKVFDFFNDALFGRALPPVLITLQRQARSRGYFAAERFTGRGVAEVAHELALNPDHFGRDDRDILSTLVHEMVHLWHRELGTLPRRAYHDRQWAAKMIEVGLQPSDTGAPDGKTTGQHMTHYVIEGGRFALAFKKLAGEGFQLRWQSQAEDEAAREKKASSKTKYTCAGCGANAWAKPDTSLICGDCYDDGDGEISIMMPEGEAGGVA